MDSILEATTYGKNLSGNDAQLIPVIADVQCRILEMLGHLGLIAGRIAGIVPQAKASRQTTQEYIGSMKKLPGN